MVKAMRSYFAVQEKNIYQGGWLSVIDWARRRIQFNPSPIKLFTAHAGDKNARIIAEITPDRERAIKGGRIISLKTLLNGKT